MPRHVLIVGAGFAGLNAAQELDGAPEVTVTLIDRQNYHLFQPLLYQVATAGLSPADIAAPIRSILSRSRNIRVLQGEALSIDLDRKTVQLDFGELGYDYLVVACGATHSYFGHPEWEQYAPGLKTISQATEIRRRVLSAFEEAERTEDPERQKKCLTFVIVGGGPTGVELAGAIGEMSRFTLARDFRRINPRSTRIVLVEGEPRILPTFAEDQAARATRDLAELGVEVLTSKFVTNVNADGVQMGAERIDAATVLWAAGTEASHFGPTSAVDVDARGRIVVQPDLSLKNRPNVFFAGDQCCFLHQTGKPLPATAPVALQQGRYIGRTILKELRGRPGSPFRFVDKGQMATIGRSRAIVEVGRYKFAGWFAWFVWLIVHIYYLTGFRNRLFVVLQWAWSYLTFRRGARLIVEKEWRQDGT